MTHKYQVSGITCEGCVSKVKSLLEKIPGVTASAVGLDGKVELTMSHHVATAELQAAMRDYPKYQLVETLHAAPITALPDEDVPRTFWETYKPILLVFGYILGATLLVEACLGAVFNLPMSKVTLFEDVLMVVMSGAMLLVHL